MSSEERDAMLMEAAAMLGLHVDYDADLPQDGRYYRDHNLILLREGMPARLHRSVLAHELCHAVFGDVPSRFGPVNAKQERRADEWAALRLITPDEYRDAETVHDGHAGAMAVELGVMVSILTAYQRVLLRAGDLVYVRPRMGAGQWDHRELVA